MAGLSDADVARYREDGFVFPVPAIAAGEAADLLAWLDDLEARHADLDAKARRHRLLRFKPHVRYTRLDRVVHHPAILDAVEHLIGPDILVWASAFFIKDARDPAFVSWHQDSATYGLDGTDLVTAWIAVTPAGPGNAGMRFAPGTHRAGPCAHRDTEAPDNMLSRGETVELAIDERAAVDVVLAPGEMSLHHIDLAHSSLANGSDSRRIGYAVRYFTPTMRPRRGEASAMLARGRDRHGHFTLEPRPRADDDPAALAAWQTALDLRERAVFGEAS